MRMGKEFQSKTEWDSTKESEKREESVMTPELPPRMTDVGFWTLCYSCHWDMQVGNICHLETLHPHQSVSQCAVW